jgi:hypothetical protein
MLFMIDMGNTGLCLHHRIGWRFALDGVLAEWGIMDGKDFLWSGWMAVA